LPPTIDEFLFAGFLRRAPVQLTQAITCALEVPAEAEMVLEGYIDPAEPLVLEGPFGDHTGFYSLADYYPKVHVTCLTRRRDPDEAWWVALNHIDPERDVRFTMGPIDVLDHSSRGFTYGSKMGIDATRKWPEEGFTREWPRRIEMDPETKQRVDAMWHQLGIRLRER